MSLSGMGGGEKFLEISNLVASVLTLLQGRREGNNAGAGTPGSSGNKVTKGSMEVLINAFALALKSFGIGNYDEAMFTKLFGQLNSEERTYWTKLSMALEQEERKTLQLLIFLMEQESDTEYEIEEIAAIKGKDGTVTQPSKTLKHPLPQKKNIRLDFMREIVSSIKAGGVEGPQIVADMLRSNELVGSESSYKRLKESRDKFVSVINEQLIKLDEVITTRKQPIAKNLILRFWDGLLVGGTQPAEPIFQNDGFWGLLWKPILRMLGIQVNK